MKTSEMIKFYNQYKADQQDGFVSNIDSYVESMLEGESKECIEDVKMKLKEMIQNDNGGD